MKGLFSEVRYRIGAGIVWYLESATGESATATIQAWRDEKRKLFSQSVVSDTLQPHGLQHARLPFHHQLLELAQTQSIPSVMPYNNLILYNLLLFLPSVFPTIMVFSNESALRIQVTKVLELQLQHQSSNEYSGLISFRIDWFDLLAAQGPLKSLL